MAADWIKMRSDLGTHPKVVRIMSALKADKLRVIGGLHAVWSIFDTHSEDGRLDGYCPEVMDSLIGWPGFSGAMINIGWLEFENDETLVMPRFGEHNGKSAKRRAQDSVRKREEREADKSPQDVQKMSASNADKKRTREEKRREEEKHMSGAVEVIEYLNVKAGRNFEAIESNTKFLIARMREGATVERLKAVIDAKVKEWLNDPKMSQYLRPATLFNAEKFGQYAGALGAKHTNGSSVLSEYDDLMRGSL
ncbi:hypothetical protein WK62_05290 [Burkholderia ubonensis]|uniref:conserved phage C-terminal domain-containing protein n=1 Tax=Burkholderia ubonensis TaxID=101571 RepID=UPI000755F36C|nr:conserved phage C-terminal domain-containing protein [Burkholderia ubonensis]KVU10679.1 hypothetical protein WK62_05290 [Burkholderia ubonensis]